MISETAKAAINAYGGAELWQQADSISAVVSVKGLAFTLKQRPYFKSVSIDLKIKQPYVKICPVGRNHEICGVLDGDTVRLEDLNGKVLNERKMARSYFPYGRRLFYWDDLDMTYFACYAFWNYFSFPYLLMRKDIRWTEKKANILEAEFPDNFPTHSKIQEFHFDSETGLLKQHNYTAEVISKLAKASHVIREHKTFNALNIPIKRVVSPMKKSGKALGYPNLIDISVEEFAIKIEKK